MKFCHRDGNRGGKCCGEDRGLGAWSQAQLLEATEVLGGYLDGMA